jgi:hypothetical protein
VFNLAMTKLIGISQSAPEDWKLTELGWIFSIAILADAQMHAQCARGSIHLLYPGGATVFSRSRNDNKLDGGFLPAAPSPSVETFRV